MSKLTTLEKISFKLVQLIGSPFSLLFHTFCIGGFFFLRYLGIVSQSFLLLLITTVCLEAIFLIIFIQMTVRNNSKRLTKMQQDIDQVQQEEKESLKVMINILHLAHQMKTLQNEIDYLKKTGVLKRSSGNGHRLQV